MIVICAYTHALICSPVWEMISLSKDIEGDFQKALDRSALDTLAFERSIVTDAFQGIVVSAMTCPCCAFQEQSLDPFFLLRFVCLSSTNA